MFMQANIILIRIRILYCQVLVIIVKMVFILKDRIQILLIYLSLMAIIWR